MNLALANKKVFITGATGHIGSYLAKMFCSEGAQVVLQGTNSSKLNELVKSIRESDGKGLFVEGITWDFSDDKSGWGLIQQSAQMLGGLDILINNAAIRNRERLENLDESNWRKTLEVNLTTPFVLAKEASMHMDSARGGSIINIGSIVAKRFLPYYVGAHYISSKSGMEGLTRALAQELGKKRIRVNTILPGLVESQLHIKERNEYATEHSYLGREILPEEVVYLCAFLASDLASGITGESIIVGGY